MPPAGFEDRDNHRIACASMFTLNKLDGRCVIPVIEEIYRAAQQDSAALR